MKSVYDELFDDVECKSRAEIEKIFMWAVMFDVQEYIGRGRIHLNPDAEDAIWRLAVDDIVIKKILNTTE